MYIAILIVAILMFVVIYYMYNNQKTYTVTIADIKQNPDKYLNKAVSVKGTFIHDFSLDSPNLSIMEQGIPNALSQGGYSIPVIIELTEPEKRFVEKYIKNPNPEIRYQYSRYFMSPIYDLEGSIVNITGRIIMHPYISNTVAISAYLSDINRA